MKNFLYIILFGFGLLPSISNRAQSIDDYLTFAEKNNPGLNAKLEEFEAAMQKIPQVSTLPDPSLTVSAFGQMVETRVGQQMARFSLSQMFPWFGTLAAQKDAAALAAEARYESYLDARNELFMKVRSAYYPLYELEQHIRLQKENLEILSTYKTLATTKFQNGRGKLSDALQVDIMMNNLNTEINILLLKKKPLQIAFNNLLSRSPNEEVVVPTDLQPPLMITFSSDSLSQNPKLTELNRKIELAEALERAAVKQGMPKLGIGFEYILVEKRPEMSFEDNGKDAYMPMFTVSLPIYRKKYRAAVSETQHMKQSYREMKSEIANRLTTEYEMALFEVNKNKEELNLYDQQVNQTKQVIDLLLAAFQNSTTDFEEILRSQQMLLKYEMNKASALKNYFVAEAKLMYLIANDK